MNDGKRLGGGRFLRRGAAAAAWALCAGAVMSWPLAATAQVAAPVVEQYRIGPGDSVKIVVYQNPDLSLEARVSEAGVVSFPLLGRVLLSGLNVTEAENRIATDLVRGGFIKNPQVLVTVTQVRANQVSLLGYFAKPGRYPLDLAGMRLTEVLALAGGVVPDAGADQVVLLGTRDGQKIRREIDLQRIFAPDGADLNVVLMPGDVLWIDRAPQVYLYGEVNRPGQIRLGRGMTVKQVLATAGGVTQRGTLRGLRISRRSADGSFHDVEPSLEDQLRDGDVIEVRESLF